MKIETIQQLFSTEINTLLSTEIFLQSNLLSCLDRLKHSSVKNALKHYLDALPTHTNKLKELLKSYNDKKDIGNRKSYTDTVFEELWKKTNEIEIEISEPLYDVIFLSRFERLLQYQLHSYTTVCVYADLLDLQKISKQMEKISDEKKDTLDLLKELEKSFLIKQRKAETENTFKPSKPDMNEIDSAGDMDKDEEHPGIDERTIENPGGRSGVSHRSYSDRESRGH